jgi:DNA-binding response OmpR family regulator
MTVSYPRRDLLQVGELTVQLPDGLVCLDGDPLMLSVREFALLLALVRAEGRIVSREQLYLEVWAKPLSKRDRSVDVYVHKLRGKLEAARPDLAFIHTHVGFGYRLSRQASQHVHNSTTAS